MSTQGQRRFPRVEAAIEVQCDCGEESFTEETLNLSLGGLYIRTIRSIEVGTTIDVQFNLPGIDHRFKVSSRVTRVNTEETSGAPPGVSVEFIDVSEEDKQAMTQFVVQSQLTQKGF